MPTWLTVALVLISLVGTGAIVYLLMRRSKFSGEGYEKIERIRQEEIREAEREKQDLLSASEARYRLATMVADKNHRAKLKQIDERAVEREKMFSDNPELSIDQLKRLSRGDTTPPPEGG